MKKVSPLTYIYAVGKIRALEKFLIKNEVFQEALEASLPDALRLFVEADLYSSELLHVGDSQQLEKVLSQELGNLKKLTRELLLDKTLLCFLDMETLNNLCQACQNYGSPFLRDYLMYLIDMHNIKSFLRLYLLKEPEEKLDSLLSYEGFIPKKDFLKLYPLDLAAFLTRLKYVHKETQTIDYTYHLGEAIRKTAQENSFMVLEKTINDFLLGVLRPAKYLNFGPEPILAYYFAKINEINLMRMIILAKLNNLSQDLVKERLNAVYA